MTNEMLRAINFNDSPQRESRSSLAAKFSAYAVFAVGALRMRNDTSSSGQQASAVRTKFLTFLSARDQGATARRRLIFGGQVNTRCSRRQLLFRRRRGGETRHIGDDVEQLPPGWQKALVN
jgi:hypothetical protein